MTELPVYADATVLIGLSRIDRLELLAMFPSPIRVTSMVWSEVTRDPDRPGVGALQRAATEGIIAIVDEGNPVAYPHLDPGESSVLSAAAAATAAVLIDERKARALLATEPDLREAISWSTGIIGLL